MRQSHTVRKSDQILRKIVGALTLSVVLMGTAAVAEQPDVPLPMPRYIIQPEPRYPADMLAQRVQGQVMVKVLIARNGLPVTTRVEKSSGHGALDNAAVFAVRQAEWEPVPEPVWVLVPINFVLK
jgi:protein TonB